MKKAKKYAALIAEKELVGRPLRANECVGFLDGDETNVSPDNLVVFCRPGTKLWTCISCGEPQEGKPSRYVDTCQSCFNWSAQGIIECHECGKTFLVKTWLDGARRESDDYDANGNIQPTENHLELRKKDGWIFPDLQEFCCACLAGLKEDGYDRLKNEYNHVSRNWYFKEFQARKIKMNLEQVVQTNRFCGKPGRSGPRKGNSNAQRHGLKSGKLPPDAKYIEIRINVIRREIESAVMATKGEISMTDAALVQTCIRWEKHAVLAQRWLTKEHDKLSASERLRFSEAVCKASDNRDKALVALKLNHNTKDTLVERLYSAIPAITNDE